MFGCLSCRPLSFQQIASEGGSRGKISDFQRYARAKTLKGKEEEAAIGDSPAQLHHSWQGANHNRAGRRCLSPRVSSCFKITDFQEAMQPKLSPVSLKRNRVRRKYYGKERGEEEGRQPGRRQTERQGACGFQKQPELTFVTC